MSNTFVGARCFESVFISDVHLGTRGCRADKLLEFLDNISCKKLFLVGDIIDGWQLKNRKYWPEEHKAVFNEFIRLAKTGTEVIFITGNHDEFLRDYSEFHFGNLILADEFVFHSQKGEKFLVVHGDRFDVITSCARWMAVLGAIGYNLLLNMNVVINYFRKKMDRPYWSLSKCVKSKVKRAINFISDFQENVSSECTKRGFQGAICGHIHQAELRKDDGFTYMNCGDWVESCTAIVEGVDGEFQLIDWLRPPPLNNIVPLPQPATVTDPDRHAA